MKWTTGSRENIEDRRGQGRFGGGMRGGPVGIGVVLVLLVLTLLTGKNFLSLVDPGAMTGGGEAPASGPAPINASPEEEKLVDFMDAVMGDNQETWSQLLGGQYQSTTLVLFRQATSTACGYGQSASGPFYCPGDGKVYLDLSFFDELHRRFGAPGDFAQAYVIAHEVGHHVQNLMGLERRVRQAQQQRPDTANDLSVRMELQADCFAGVWGHSAAQRGKLDVDDVDEGLRAAAAIGDDRIQRQSGGTVSPESFTHGSSAQRMEWFRRGLERGSPDACDTFGR
jgi:predicted metalloprotease